MKIDIEEIKTITLEENQKLVVKIDDSATTEDIEKVADTLGCFLPEAKGRIIVCRKGIEFSKIDINNNDKEIENEQ